MRERLPSVRPQEVIRALEKAGWVISRQRGSHVTLAKSGVRFIVTVPLRRGDIPRGTLTAILRDAGLSVDEFRELLAQ